MFNGYRTVAAGIVSVIAGVLTMLGVAIPAETLQQLSSSIETVIGGMATAYGVIMIIFRAVTSSPMFNKAKKLPGVFPFSLVCLLLITGCSMTAKKSGPVANRALSKYCMASQVSRDRIRKDWDTALTPYKIRITCPGDKQE